MSFAISDDFLPATLNCHSMTDGEFELFCAEHPDLNFEMTAEGELIVMAPTHFLTGARNARIGRYLDAWSEDDGRGLAFDSSTGFVLPNGARRSPDSSWVLKNRIVSAEDGFLHLCPDFVIELKSQSDRPAKLRQKMRAYLSNGAQLGWLIDSTQRSLTIYRPQADPETRIDIDSIAGEGMLATFMMNLSFIWNPL